MQYKNNKYLPWTEICEESPSNLKISDEKFSLLDI
jgi:hypothetical protein